MAKKEVTYTFRIKLHPTKEQELKFIQFCGGVRWIYNWALQRWKHLHSEGSKPTGYELLRELTCLKKMDATCWLYTVPNHSLQQAVLALENGFSSFLKGKNGYPNFKKRGVRDSFTYPEYVRLDQNTNQIVLPKIGPVRYYGSLPSDTTIKKVTVVREGDGWYACIRTIKQIQERSPNTKSIGIDMGVATMATVHDGRKALGFPHHSGLDKMIRRINILQEFMSRKQRKNKVNSKNREKARAKLAKAYARLTNMRKDHLHKVSSALVKRYGTIVVEDLKIKNMTKSAVGTVEEPNMGSAAKRGLNRVITKQAWGLFFKMLEYKCNWYGRKFIKVDPKNTSRTCPACNHIAKENRESQAVFKCVACGHQAHADHVGALNVLRRGLGSLVTS